jgi:dihydrolipoamide dehydrogenase
MTTTSFDVIVIGAGPGGYIAAIRAAQLGLKTACIDEWKNAAGGPAPGGTCTNVGCIPSKALLQSSEHYEHAARHFADHGIGVKGLSLDVAKMIGRKDDVVKQNNDGILYLFKKNKVTFFHGTGRFVGGTADAWQVQVGDQVLTGKQVVVATGSSARALPGVPFDEDKVLSNDGALRIGAVPKKLGLIGAGVIGLEMGSVWRRLGAEVTVLEGLPTFLGAVDEQIAREAHKAFVKQGLKIELGVKVGEVKTGKKGVSVAWTSAKGEAQTLEVDKLIVSIGRVPNTAGLNPEAVGLKLDERGAIIVDADCRSSVPGIWAAGRCWRTRRRRKAWRWPSASPASTATWTSTSSPGSSTPAPRSPGSARPSSSSRPRAGPTRPAPSRSWPTAARVRWATPPAWSSSWPTPRPTRSWACTSSARWPAS